MSDETAVASTTQADNWQDVAKAVKLVGRALERIPAPPVPEDSMATALNMTLNGWNSLKDIVYAHANLELEQQEGTEDE